MSAFESRTENPFDSINAEVAPAPAQQGTIRIDDVRRRYRRDLGDLARLADSIAVAIGSDAGAAP